MQGIKDRTAQRQILSITDDRIQTEQQLATVYSKWSAQVLLQHRIVLHLILQSLALIAFIGICMVACDALVRRMMATQLLDQPALADVAQHPRAFDPGRRGHAHICS